MFIDISHEEWLNTKHIVWVKVEQEADKSEWYIIVSTIDGKLHTTYTFYRKEDVLNFAQILMREE